MTAGPGVNYYERHLGDYARDTGHLTMLEHGAYTILLDRFYATGAGIPADKVHRLARAKTPAEIAAVDVVLSDFFCLVDGAWVNNRAAEELLKIAARVDAARENGKKGGRPKGKAKESQPITPGIPNPNPDLTQIEALQAPSSNLQAEALDQTPIPDGNTVEGPIGAAAPDDRSGSLEGHTPEAVTAATERGLKLVAISVELRKAGCPDARASDSFLVAAIAEGFTLEQLLDLAMAYPGKPIKYLVNTARGRRAEANNPTTSTTAQARTSNVVPHRPGGSSPVLPAEELKAREVDALAEMRRQYPELYVDAK